MTDRQIQIIKLMAKGLTNDQISKRIGFSSSTVRMESMAIYRFLSVDNRQSAVLVAKRLGYLSNSDTRYEQLALW